jgi:hypothetical protein
MNFIPPGVAYVEDDDPVRVEFRPLHLGQKRIVANLGPKNVIRCGRRFGKTTMLEEVFVRRAVRHRRKVGWLAEQYKLLSPTFANIRRRFAEVILKADANASRIDFYGGGLIEFWTLDNEDAGRSRDYDDIVIDEASLKKKGLREIIEQALAPTMLDRAGTTMTMAGTPKGIDPDSYFYMACEGDKSLGWKEFHAPTWENPWLDPEKVANLKNEHPPLVYQQEFCAEFVDWSGDAFFTLERFLENGQPVEEPKICDGIFLFIDTAVKTGREHDGTASLVLAYTRWPKPRVVLLDYDIVQIEGALLERWLPQKLKEGEEWALRCRARTGFQGAFIEDKSSGMILLQQAQRRGLKAQAIGSKLTSVGKEERAVDVSGYVYRGWIRFGRHCFDKVVTYKGQTANHLRKQVIGYRVGLKEHVEDDLLDCFTYGLAMTCGDSLGF